MGQAKRRGSYEVRLAEGVERRQLEALERDQRRQQQIIDRQIHMTPEEMRKAAEDRATMLTIFAAAQGFAYPGIR
jgi:hypothetical protein